MRLAGGGQFQRLTGEQTRQFYTALLDAYPSLDQIDQTIAFMGKNRQRITLGGSLEQIVLQVIERAEAESWTSEFLQAARMGNPGNPPLLEFAQQFGLAPATPEGPQLERMIKQANGYLEARIWLERLGQLLGQVCRIEVPVTGGTLFGTGFLLAPNKVMTNYHVIEKVHQEKVAPRRVSLRFDYQKMVNGAPVNPGKVYRLAEPEWLVDFSPYSPLDTMTDPGDKVPEHDQLDYALLRVEGAPGQDSVSGTATTSVNAPKREWLKPSSETHDFTEGSTVFILQHPAGAPLKLALDTNSVLEVNANQTRVRYSTNTEPGSSGSPCFDADWNLIALHHAGDPNYADFHRPEYNEGIPFSTIVELLDERGKLMELEAGSP